MNHSQYYYLRRFAIPALVVIFVSVASASYGRALTLRGGTASVTTGKSFELTIEAGQAKGLGAIQFTLLFDPKVANLESAELAPGVNGMIEAQVRETGQLRIKVALGEGLEADGPLVTVSGQAAGGGASEVKIEELRAWSFEPVLELGTSSDPGTIRVVSSETGGGGLSVIGWVLVCSGVLAVLIIVLLLKKR